MRDLFVCLGLAGVIAATAGDANAQRREEPQPARATEQPQRAQRTAEPAQRNAEPAQRQATARQFVVQPATGAFQRRRPADKQATLLQFQIEVAGQQLGEAFTLTPRAPYVAQRGSLDTHRAIHALRDGDTPNITMLGDDAFATVYIQQAKGKRFLVECQATASGLEFTTSWSGSPTVMQGPAQGGLYSVVSPVLTGDVATVKLTRFKHPNAATSLWLIGGCEVTRFQ